MRPHADTILWRLGKGKDGNKSKNMKSFKSTAWLLPQPVLIIGTYDKEGKPNARHDGVRRICDSHKI